MMMIMMMVMMMIALSRCIKVMSIITLADTSTCIGHVN